MFTMEVILATAFRRDISLHRGKETPLIRAAISVFQSLSAGMSENTAYLEWVMMIILHFL